MRDQIQQGLQRALSEHRNHNQNRNSSSSSLSDPRWPPLLVSWYHPDLSDLLLLSKSQSFAPSFTSKISIPDYATLRQRQNHHYARFLVSSLASSMTREQQFEIYKSATQLDHQFKEAYFEWSRLLLDWNEQRHLIWSHWAEVEGLLSEEEKKVWEREILRPLRERIQGHALETTRRTRQQASSNVVRTGPSMVMKSSLRQQNDSYDLV